MENSIEIMENSIGCWLNIESHLINLDNVGGFSIQDRRDDVFELVAYYPASTYILLSGTEKECLAKRQAIIDCLIANNRAVTFL